MSKEDTSFSHITKVHPCFNEKIHDKVGRIHIPIAPKCNIQCGFCTRSINKTENRPGVSSEIMTVNKAIEHIRKVTSTDQPINVVGVAGPGDSLYNESTLVLFKKIGEEFPEMPPVRGSLLFQFRKSAVCRRNRFGQNLSLRLYRPDGGRPGIQRGL